MGQARLFTTVLRINRIWRATPSKSRRFGFTEGQATHTQTLCLDYWKGRLGTNWKRPLSKDRFAWQAGKHHLWLRASSRRLRTAGVDTLG